ncbi:MAG: hypothetical protein H0X70_04595 [Segetibacter sp.]|nr:hypothetical protein [Segetibacter sp.]
MKGYRSFMIVFSVLFILYIIAEINKPKPIDWTVTISKNDKNPYGGFIVYQQLKNIFPKAGIQSFRMPVYNQVNKSKETNSAYFIIGPTLALPATDFAALKKYVRNGNTVVASANMFHKSFLGFFGIETATPVSLSFHDSSGINFVNPALKAHENYTFLTATIDQYFSKIDTAKTTIISTNNKNKPVYIKVPYGKGVFYIHANPLCFSNYFLLYKNNAAYTAKVLSYLPAETSKIYWDEFYKLGPEGAATPFRFILSNEFLRWALRLSLIGLVLYVFFEMKRRQRVIPVITPLKNSTLEFVKTVAGVYFNDKDNNSIVDKKVSHFLEFVRSRFNIATHNMDEDFIQQLHRKSGVDKDKVSELVKLFSALPAQTRVTDIMLLNLDRNIDHFYKQA